MKVRIEIIDKQRAIELRAKNTNNFRKLNRRKVEEYARQMKNGLWQTNGDAIQIYADGTLANGQHRIEAIILADVAIPVVVAYDIDNNVSVFDFGSKRTVQQMAKTEGLTLSTQKAGAIGMLLFGVNSGVTYGGNEILDFYKNNMETLDSVEKVTLHGASNPILRRAPCIAAGYCAYMLGKINLSQLENFSIIANSGLPIDGIASNAPLCLRKTIMGGFNDSTGKVITWGSQINALLFDVCYRAILDYAKGANPYRAYKTKMKKEEINKILSDVRELTK